MIIQERVIYQIEVERAKIKIYKKDHFWNLFATKFNIYIYIRLNYFHFELVDSYKSLWRIKTKRGERRGEKAKKIQRTILLGEREREREKSSTSSEFVSLPFNDPLISRNRADIA